MLAGILSASFNHCDVSQTDRAPSDVGYQEIAEFLRGFEFAQTADREFCIGSLDSSRWQVNIFPLQGLHHFGDGEVSRTQSAIVNPNTHRIATLTRDHDVRNPRQPFKAGLDLFLGDRGQLNLIVPIAVQGKPHNGPRICVAFCDQWLFCILRQIPSRSGHAISNVTGGGLNIAVEIELNRDGRNLLATGREDMLHTLDPVQEFFEGLRDRSLDDFGRRAGVDGGHRDQRRIDIGQFPIAQAGQRNQAKQHNQQRHHHGENRAINTNRRKPQPC